MTTTTKRQTAANNAFLAAARRLFNDRIYREVKAIVNDPARGETAAREYLLENHVTGLDF